MWHDGTATRQELALRSAVVFDTPTRLGAYRVSGAGPAFRRFGNRARYLRSDLDGWAAKRRATTTAEADRLKAA